MYVPPTFSGQEKTSQGSWIPYQDTAGGRQYFVPGDIRPGVNPSMVRVPAAYGQYEVPGDVWSTGKPYSYTDAGQTVTGRLFPQNPLQSAPFVGTPGKGDSFWKEIAPLAAFALAPAAGYFLGPTLAGASGAAAGGADVASAGIGGAAGTSDVAGLYGLGGGAAGAGTGVGAAGGTWGTGGVGLGAGLGSTVPLGTSIGGLGGGGVGGGIRSLLGAFGVGGGGAAPIGGGLSFPGAGVSGFTSGAGTGTGGAGLGSLFGNITGDDLLKWGVPLAGLGASLLFSNRAIPEESYLRNQQSMGTQGRDLVAKAQSGQLTPGQQAQIQRWTQSQMGAARQYLINSGQGTDSTAMLQLQANVEQQALAISQGFLDQSFNQGMQMMQIGDQATQQLVIARLHQQEQTGNAISNFMNVYGMMMGWGKHA